MCLIFFFIKNNLTHSCWSRCPFWIWYSWIILRILLLEAIHKTGFVFGARTAHIIKVFDGISYTDYPAAVIGSRWESSNTWVATGLNTRFTGGSLCSGGFFSHGVILSGVKTRAPLSFAPPFSGSSQWGQKNLQ